MNRKTHKLRDAIAIALLAGAGGTTVAYAQEATTLDRVEVTGSRIKRVDVEGPLPVICRSGARSAQVVAYLLANGIDAVNVDGGPLAWARAGKPMTADRGEPYVV